MLTRDVLSDIIMSLFVDVIWHGEYSMKMNVFMAEIMKLELVIGNECNQHE